MPLKTLEEFKGDRRFDGCDELHQDAVLLGQIVAEGRRVHEIVKAERELYPVIRRGQRHFDLGDDAVGAIGVGNTRQVFSGEFQNAWLSLHGDNA